MDVFLPLTTFEIEHPDFNSLDLDAEAARYLQRQRAIMACLAGEEHPDTVLDMLEAHAIDPVAYVDEVEQSIDLIIRNNIEIEL